MNASVLRVIVRVIGNMEDPRITRLTDDAGDRYTHQGRTYVCVCARSRALSRTDHPHHPQTTRFQLVAKIDHPQNTRKRRDYVPLRVSGEEF